jgi:hypothetical protein
MAYKRQRREYTGGVPRYGWRPAADGFHLDPHAACWCHGKIWLAKTVCDRLQSEVAQTSLGNPCFRKASWIPTDRERQSPSPPPSPERQRPDLAARTAGFLPGNRSVETLETLMIEPFEKATQLRLPREALARAEGFVPLLARHLEFRTLGRLSKATVLRLAVPHDLEVVRDVSRGLPLAGRAGAGGGLLPRGSAAMLTTRQAVTYAYMRQELRALFRLANEQNVRSWIS